MTTHTKTILFVLQLVETIKILRKELVDKIVEIKMFKDQAFNRENGDDCHDSEITNLNKEISDLKETNAQLSTKLVNSEKNVAILKEEMTKMVQIEKGNDHNTAQLEIEKLKEEILNLRQKLKVDTSESQNIANQEGELADPHLDGDYKEIRKLLTKKNKEISSKVKTIANEAQYIYQDSKTFSSGSFFFPAPLIWTGIECLMHSHTI